MTSGMQRKELINILSVNPSKIRYLFALFHGEMIRLWLKYPIKGYEYLKKASVEGDMPTNTLSIEEMKALSSTQKLTYSPKMDKIITD